MQPNPDLCAFSIMKSMKQKAELWGSQGSACPGCCRASEFQGTDAATA